MQKAYHASYLHIRSALYNENGIIRKWISRFDVWPYLEKFTELVKLLQNYNTPDFIIGNYIGGNLVVSLLSYRMGITQCNIAHALEKTKYPDSDIYLKKFDEKYRFSCQFTVDIIAMNNANFIITSTYQEIAGRYASEYTSDSVSVSWPWMQNVGLGGAWRETVLPLNITFTADIIGRSAGLF